MAERHFLVPKFLVPKFYLGTSLALRETPFRANPYFVAWIKISTRRLGCCCSMLPWALTI
jgi:hypothetical protein